MNETHTIVNRYPFCFTPLLYLSLLFFTAVACNNDNESLSQVSENFSHQLPGEEGDLFKDITVAAGISFEHNMGDDYLTNVIESVGGGCVFFDYNQNGLMDLYIANGIHHDVLSSGERSSLISGNVLYENLGNGRFADRTQQSRTGDLSYSMAVTVGDFDNDGFPDIYVSNYGPNTLFRNNGDGTFTDVTERAGVAGNESSAGAVWLDYNRNGLLDLYVANYVEFNPNLNLAYAPDGYPGPLNFRGQPDRLYRNNGDGTFTDVTVEMGLYRPEGRAMGVGSIDIDGDGYPEIFVANDAMPNYLFKNNQGESFTDIAVRAGIAFNRGGEATASMAFSFGDYTGNGDIDLFVTDDTYNSLYQNRGGLLFSDVSFQSGIAMASGQHVGWAASFIDYNNNTLRDLFITNGELKHTYGQEDQLFRNNGDGSFTEISAELGSYFSQARVGRGACIGDYDNDGDLDIFIVNLNEASVLLRNDTAKENHWLLVDLIGTRSNRDGIGASVSVTAGGITQVAQKTGGGHYLSQNDPRLHFGLAEHNVIDLIEVKWPSGAVQILENISANQILTIEEE
ncbi:MAG: CRTAC1 family protein [Balneolaceae bacterium]|nr:MAG: CRTAC1 family protein [Balneolaceae bacterium]